MAKKYRYVVNGMLSCELPGRGPFKHWEVHSQLRTIFVTATTKRGAMRQARARYAKTQPALLRGQKSCSWHLSAERLGKA